MSGKALSTTSELIGAIRSGHLSAVIAALDNGADIEESDIHGHSGLPLRTACFGGNSEIVAELIRRGADLNARGSDGVSQPLRLAVRCKQRSIALLLIEHGAKIPDGVEISQEWLGSTKTPDLPPLEMPPPEKGEGTPYRILRTSDKVELPPLEIVLPTPEPAPTLAATTSDEPAVDIPMLDNPELPPLEMPAAAGLAAAPVVPDFDIIENIDIGRSYGTDTNLLTMDLLRFNESQEQAAAAASAPEKPEAGKTSFWKAGRSGGK